MERIETVDELFIEVTKLIARRSGCGRMQVGAIIVRGYQIISSGCNGPLDTHDKIPRDFNCECDKSTKCEIAIHAEQNAIMYAAKNGVALSEATLYCTHSPCITCARFIRKVGILKVVYLEEYRDTKPLTYLATHGIRTLKYS
jgi:dCMP deaminase